MKKYLIVYQFGHEHMPRNIEVSNDWVPRDAVQDIDPAGLRNKIIAHMKEPINIKCAIINIIPLNQ